jgi:Cys-rich repeat protein
MNFLSLKKPLLSLFQTFVLTGIFSAVACGNDQPSGPVPVGPVKACSTDGECSQPDPYCVGGICAQCLSDANCGGRTCNLTNNRCVQCTTNAECGGGAPYCNTTTNQCVQCVGDGNCAMGQTCDATTGRCQLSLACQNDSQCMLPFLRHCGPNAQCVACLSNADCGAGTPYCNTAQDYACVQCLTDANCTGANGGGSTCRGNRCR